MKSILIGNGINIQFGNSAYTSKSILKRIEQNAKNGKYNSLFGDKISGDDIVIIFEGLVNIANGIIENTNMNISDNYLLDASDSFKERYINPVKELYEIMLEDWFFLVHIFYEQNKDIRVDKKATMQGFKQIFLDGIYNDGNIQTIHLNMNDEVKNFLDSFDNIFTLNYDNNIELLLNRNVYHLHGDFSVLADSENIDSVMGYIKQKKGRTSVISGMEHCYCNALFECSGKLKRAFAENAHRCIELSDRIVAAYDNYQSFQSKLGKYITVDAEMIKTKFEHPELKIATEYYFHEFKNIDGELYILGISPNNDEHIFDMIMENKKITNVMFYYWDKREKEIIKNRKFRSLECRNVAELWKILSN